MPLHAITTLHGEVGLRERLTIETERFPEADWGSAHYGAADPHVLLRCCMTRSKTRDLCPDGGKERALAALAVQFGQRVADLVAAVTNPEPEPGKTGMGSTASMCRCSSGNPLGAGDQGV